MGVDRSGRIFPDAKRLGKSDFPSETVTLSVACRWPRFAADAIVREAQSRKHTVEDEHLVPGDIVLLEAGEEVPADLRLLAAPADRNAGGRLPSARSGCDALSRAGSLAWPPGLRA